MSDVTARTAITTVVSFKPYLALAWRQSNRGFIRRKPGIPIVGGVSKTDEASFRSQFDIVCAEGDCLLRSTWETNECLFLQHSSLIREAFG
ncbi:MAG: hypothetical protein VXZ82_05720 [Planctomycetota bacterium]|nr:hypothetical protein [Planctomycetota bacterium]